MQKVIDAKDKKIGRIATEVAALLLGKDSPSFVKNKTLNREVRVLNCSGMDLDAKRLEYLSQKRYSGYPGGLKIVSAGKVIEKVGRGGLLRLVVRNMLPKNTLRTKRLKNLVTEE